MTANELDEKLSLLNKKARSLRHKFDEIEEDLEHTPIGDGVGMGYVQAAQIEDKADDNSAQFARMSMLLNKSKDELVVIGAQIQEFRTTNGKIEAKPNLTDPLRYLDQEMWRIEIDIENANDLSRRLTEDGK